MYQQEHFHPKVSTRTRGTVASFWKCFVLVGIFAINMYKQIWSFLQPMKDVITAVSMSNTTNLNQTISTPYESEQDNLGSDWPLNHPCRGKERLLRLLKQANASMNTNPKEALCTRLPTWDTISTLYGDQPIIYGLDTCDTYQSILSNQQRKGVLPMPRVGGLYSTGTNAMTWTFIENIQHSTNVQKDLIGQLHPYEIPWGKHTSATHRLNVTYPRNNTDEVNLTLPIIMIRDPYRWMQSMCKQSYHATWRTSRRGCPNFIADEGLQSSVVRRIPPHVPTILYSTTNPNATTTPLVPVHVKNPALHGTIEVYPSLADMWSIWNRMYVKYASYPRLVVRYEDYLFHTEQVFRTIATCVGLAKNNATDVKPFHFHVGPSKVHGHSKYDFLPSIILTGNVKSRARGMSKDDLDYAQTGLDADLMKLFHYTHPKPFLGYD